MDWINLIAPIVLPILATVLTGVVTWAVKKYLGIELDKNQQAQAKQIVLAVEEKALATVKRGQDPLPGELKRTNAAAQLMVLNPAMTVTASLNQIDRAVGSLPCVGALKESCAPVVTG